MKFTVSKQFTFEAAHSLPYLPIGHKCRGVHGHSYMVEIFCRGSLDKRGFVVDYAEIATAMARPLALLDHPHTYDHPEGLLVQEVIGCPSTAENLAAWLFKEIKPDLPSLVWVDVHETRTTCVRVER
jgi:6-pyruvoyltetrahydropterin/6-carboxytetrahydropterin synthase